MKNYILLSLILWQVAVTAQTKSYDWRNAPENPFTPDQIQRIDRQGVPYGKVITVGDKWYDQEGNLINTAIVTVGRDVAAEYNATVVDRDDQGRIITEISYTAGKPETKVYTYDSNGNMLSWESTPSNKKTVYTYDDRGRIIKDVYSSDTFEYTTIYTYTNKGKALVVDKKETNKDGVLVNHYIKEYREGLIRSSEEVGQGKDTFTYEFDKEYNWIKRYKNGSKYFDDERTIYYYDQVDPNDFGNVIVTVAPGSYGKYVLESSVAGIPLKAVKIGDYLLIYNPLKKQYHTVFKAQEQLVEGNVGKKLSLKSYDANMSLMKVKKMRLVNGVRQY
ncbi:hypothetical protein BST97_05840 [Nonlabens spongiae]|uniref:Type IV secretion protein Rhs n=1 Tax=Nonlabens spongiae TaxID=331648 RepID=A0A1W6MJ74_9FLAO|nr:hypothetical protein [Nonlabens spongiae]ARN77546.1 hypothetical protein BST97_05840 [Nonlabens spongiae]